MEEIKTKVCTKCSREMPITEFARRSAAKDGLQSYCKKCQREATTAAYHKRRERKRAEEAAKNAPVIPVLTTKDLGGTYNLAKWEKDIIVDCINNNPSKSFGEYASMLGISERTLYRKIQAYDLRDTISDARSYSEGKCRMLLADYDDIELLEELYNRDYDGNIWKTVRKETTISKLFGKK